MGKIAGMFRVAGKLIPLLIVVSAIFAIALMTTSGALADVSLGGGQNCDANAVVYCGATSASQLVTKYNGGDGQNSAASIQSIYNYFGITSSDVQSLPTVAVAGTVTKSGNVYVGSQLVATNALTAGRQNITGSTTESDSGTTFYTRPPSVSFEQSSLNAYVVMSNGQFSFAILSSCGNPVKAIPVAPPAPTPQPASSGTCTNLSLTQSSDNPREVSAVATDTVQNGATLSGVSFNWGDGSSIQPSSPSLSAEHLYQQDGNYTVVATLTFNGSQSIPSVTCEAPITISTTAPVCGGLNIQVNGNKVTVTNFTYSANNSGDAFDYATLNWGDSSPIVSSNSISGQTHTYSIPGQYTIMATAYFNVNDQAAAYTGQDCQQALSLTPPPSTPTTPPVVTTAAAVTTTLANTGPGDVVGIFVGSVMAGALAYRKVLGRRLKN
jgi:hypothetical protein